MTEPLKVQPVHIIDLKRPWRLIAQLECPIIRGKRMTWAQGPRHRHMLGGSAFFLRSQAERRKLNLLHKASMNPALVFVAPGIRDAAFKALHHYHETGEL